MPRERDCVDIVSTSAEPTRNFYRVRFRNPKLFVGGKYSTPQWGQRAAMTIGTKYYGVSGCKITMAQPVGGRWMIQNVLIPKHGGVEMTEELALQIANHIQDRIEREGQWSAVLCRDNETKRYVSQINGQHIVRDSRGRFAPHAAEDFEGESYRQTWALERGYYVPDKAQKQYEAETKRFKKIARKYGFKAYFMGDGGKEDLPNQVVLEAKNTDGEWNTWFTINLDTGKLRLRGNTDHSNLWFCETRKDMTPRKLVRFVKEINAFITSVKPHILVRHLIDPEDYQEIANINDAYDDDRYFMGAESFRVGDEGMFEGGEVRITSIEDNSEDGRQNVYFFTYLDEEGNSDGFTHTSGERRFLNQFSMFPRDWNAEEFEAQRIQYDYIVHREPRGTEVDDEGNRIPNPRGGWFTSAPNRRDAENFDAEQVQFDVLKGKPSEGGSDYGEYISIHDSYEEAQEVAKRIRKNLADDEEVYIIKEVFDDETFDSISSKKLMSVGKANKAQYLSAEEIEERRRKRCKECEAENVGTEEVDYCYTCGEMGQWGDSESPESCPECGRNSVGTEDVDYCYTCGSFGLWYETLGYYEGEEFESPTSGGFNRAKQFYDTCSSQAFTVLGRKLYYRCSHIGTFTGASSAFNKGGLNTYSGGQRGLRTATDFSDFPIMNSMAEISQQMKPSDINDWKEVISATNQIMASNRPKRKRRD